MIKFESAEVGQKIQDLMDMLTGGDLPPGFVMANQPQLTHKQAFSVVWFLQEHLGVIPDCYEMCSHCKLIFNAGEDVHSLGEEQYNADVDWYKEIDITLEMVMEHEDMHFCSSDCELEFWMERAIP